MAIEAGKTPVSRPPHGGQGSGTATTPQRAAASANAGVNSFAAMLADVDLRDAPASGEGATIVDASAGRDDSHGVADGQREPRTAGERGERRRPKLSTRATVDADAAENPAAKGSAGTPKDLGTASGATAPVNVVPAVSLVLPLEAMAGGSALTQQPAVVGDSLPVRATVPQLRALSSTQQLQNAATGHGSRSVRGSPAGIGLDSEAAAPSFSADAALTPWAPTGRMDRMLSSTVAQSQFENSMAETASGILEMVTGLGSTAAHSERTQESAFGSAASLLSSEGADGPLSDAVDSSTYAQVSDEVVQEPVRFWLGGDQSQQAELTVDDVAGASVDVTVRLYGKETQIAFHSDERVARDALQAHSSHLKSLLGQEGLTLTSLTVGSSGNGAAGGFGQGGPGKEAGNAKGARVERVRVGADDSVGSSSSTLNSRGTGGGAASTRLDLYV